jgi:hypothetical protein
MDRVPESFERFEYDVDVKRTFTHKRGSSFVHSNAR